MIKRMTILLAAFAFVGSLSACFGGKDIDLSCDEPRFYESAVIGKRVKAPEGLDDLDDYKEMPIPEATTTQARPPGSPCVDRPPNVLINKN
jgi:uncharacterized lipoprotein